MIVRKPVSKLHFEDFSVGDVREYGDRVVTAEEFVANPALMMISERGRFGDHQLAQAIVRTTVRPVLETLGIEHFAIERNEDVEFVVDGMIKQAYATQAPAAMILSPLLTKKTARASRNR